MKRSYIQIRYYSLICFEMVAVHYLGLNDMFTVFNSNMQLILFLPYISEPSKETTKVTDFREYTYVAGASPPPPSEFSAPAPNTPSTTTPPHSRPTTHDSRRTKVRSREMDARYIIDPVHRQSTNLGMWKIKRIL